MQHSPNDVTLFFDQGFVEKQGLGQVLVNLRELGYPVLACHRGHLDSLGRDVPEAGCWLGFGAIPFIREAQKMLSHTPLAYFASERFYVSQYAHKLPQHLMLNDDAVFMPCATLLNRVNQMKSLFGGDGVFVRPDSGAKVFTGNAFTYQDLGAEVHALKQLTSLTDDTMLVVAGLRNIQAEYRTFIVNRQVISGSRYDHEGNTDATVPAEVNAVAALIAEHPWQIDVAYSCDIAITEQGCRVIELNAGSTSGMYAADSQAVIVAMAEAAWLEFIGEVSMED